MVPRFKVAFDPVHQYINLGDDALALIDTPEYQRLRDLKQLGACYFIFPGASHNRFEHSLGVHHLSGLMVNHFATTQPELRITEQETTYVRLAGLVHDLGHGPFSHVFDGQFIPTVRPGENWHHESMSAALLDTLLDDNDVGVLDEPYEAGDAADSLPVELRSGGTRDVCGRDVVKFMLHPPEPPPAAPGTARVATSYDETCVEYRRRRSSGGTAALHGQSSRDFLFQIVANAHTGIDTDKFDYLARDSHNLGLASSFDYRRVMYSARVMPNGQVAYHAKEAMAMNEMFHTRYRLFRTIYLHRATRCVSPLALA